MSRGLYINLLPPEIQKKRKAEKGLIIMATAIVLFVGLLIGISFLFGLKVSQEQAKLDTLKTKTAAIDKQIAKYNIFKERKESVAKHEGAVKAALARQLFWHRFLNEVSMVIPDNVTIDKLSLTNDQVSMSGSAFNHQGVAELMVRMSDLDELKDIWIDGSKDSELEETKMLGQGDSSDTGYATGGTGSSTSSTAGVKTVQFTLTAKLKNPGAGSTVAPSSSSSSSSAASKASNSSSQSNSGSQ